MDGRSGGANHSNDGAPPARHPPTTVGTRQSRHVKCSAWKVINIDAKSFYTIYTVNDPRKQYIRFRKTEPADLPVPIFVLDNNTVGLPPKREVSIYGLNDNINEAFLRDMCEKIGSISEITIYRHPRTKKHMGMALVVFSEPKLAELFVAKNDGCSVMGGVITCFLDPYASKISKRYEQLGMECAPIPEYLKNISDSKINELRRSLNTPHSPHETPYHDDGPSCSGIDRVEETLEQFFDSMPSRSPCESTTPRAAIETPSCSTFVRSTTPTTPPPSKKITHNKNHKNNINNAMSKNISSNADKENSDFVNNTSKPPKLLFAESGCSITKTPGTPQSDLVSDVRGRCPLPPEPPSSTSTTTIPPLSRAPFPVHAPPPAPVPASIPVSLVPPNGAAPLLPPPPFFLSTPTPHMPPSPLPFCSSPLINQHPPPQNAFYPILPSPAPHLVTPSLISSAASLPMKATDYVPPPPPPPSDSVLKSFSVTNLSTLPPPQPPHSIATPASHPDASGYRIVKTPTTPEEPPPMDPMPFEQSNIREREDVKNVSSSSKKDANKFRKEGLNNRVEKLRHLTDDSKTQHKRRHATCSPSTVSSSEDQKESGSEQEDVSDEEDGEDPESDLSTTAFQRKTKNEHRSSRKRHHAEAIVEEKRKYYKRKNYAEGSKDYYKEVVIRTLDEVKDRKETNTSRCHGDSRELVQEVERYQRIRRYKRRRSEDELRGSLSPEEVVRQSRKNPLETDDIDLPDLKSISSDEDDTEETRNDSRNENGTDSNYQKRKYGGSTRYDDRARLRTPTQQQSDRNRRSGMGFSTAPQRSSSLNCTRLATTGNSASGLDRRDRILSDRRIPSFFEIDVSLPPQSQSNRRKTMAVSSTAGGCASSIDRRRGHRWSSTSASDDSFSDTDESVARSRRQTATIATNNANEQSLSAQQQRSSFEQRLETLFHTNSAANQSLESVCKESPQTPSIGTPASVFTPGLAIFFSPVMCDSSPAVTPNYVDQSTNVASRRAEKINNTAVETCSTPQGHLTGGSTHFNATNLSKPASVSQSKPDPFASMDTVSKIDRSRSKEAEEDAERRRKEEQAKILEAIERERDRFEQEKKLAEEREARRREHERKLEIQRKRAIRGKCVDKMFERLYTDLSAVLVKDALRKMELLVVEKLEVSWAKSLEEQNEKVKDENKGTTTAESGKAVLKGPRTPPEKSVLTPSSKNSLNEMVRKVAAQSKAEMSAAFGPEAAGMLGADFLFQGFGAIRNMPSFKKKVVKPAVTSSLSSKRDKSNDSSRRSRRERSGSVSSRRSDADSSGSSSRSSSSSSSATTSRSTTPARSESASRASLRDTELEKQKNRASKSLKQRSNRE
ncbi:unnamed protein product [Anisakis simplex]|uniref:RRM domain-containing protein n=1 Tax=Anisakis simplex TaxID=6269 RepID=A0A0M3K543_ANISI|nr:unnamed protein product [Anisakis simplex]